MSYVDQFKRRLHIEWLDPFCDARHYSNEGFVQSSVDNLCESDARDFMLAIDKGLIAHQAGTFTASCSKAKEQIFWQGARDSVPRKITLWIEPIITMAGLLRLEQDCGWDVCQLGMQSKTWAFDLVGYDKDLKRELLVCEVKKTVKEVDDLISFMEKHAGTQPSEEDKFKGSERNAIKKISGLRNSASEVLWVLGPNCYQHVFHVSRRPDGLLKLSPTDGSALSATKFA